MANQDDLTGSGSDIVGHNTVEDRAAATVAVRRDWTKGSVVGNFLSLSWPMIVSESSYLVTIMDMIWIGRLGASAIAGAGVAIMVVFLVLSLQMGLTVGSRALVARFFGAGDHEAGNHILAQAMIIAATYGSVVAAVGIIFPWQIIRLFGLQADALAQGASYLRLVATGWLTSSIWITMYYNMQSSGDAVSPMRIEILVRVLHLFLCPSLIFGWWIFPRIGTGGAGLSNAVTEAVGLVIGLVVLFSGKTRLRLTPKAFRFDATAVWRIMRISIPSSIMSMQRSIGNIALMWFIVPFGTVAVAAHSICQRVDMVLSVPTFGLSQGAGVLVGQNLGAGKPGRAQKSGWVGVGVVQIFLIVCSAVLFVWAGGVIRLFNSDPELVAIGGTFLRIATAGYLVLGLSTVLQQCIASAGDTMVAMTVGIVATWAVQVPLAYLLPHLTHLGVNGVRWSIVASTAASAVIYVAYFQMGRWKHKKV